MVNNLKLFSNTINTLENALNYSTLKQKVISQNIANVDTPNYKAQDVTFKKAFEQAVSNQFSAYQTNERHINFNSKTSLHPQIITKRNVKFNQNGNSVDMDKEMADLATNQIYYNAMIERINGKFNSLQSVIRGGK